MATENQQVTLAPYSQEAEEALLGAVVVASSAGATAYTDCAGIVTPEDFYLVRHAYIWEAFREIHRRGDPVDFVTLVAQLSAMNQLADVGGPGYILTLVNATPTSLHATTYAKLVSRAAERRRLLRLADEIKALAMDEGLSMETIRTGVVARVGHAQLGRGESHLVTYSEAMAAYYDYVDSTQDMPDVETTGLPTGFAKVDKETDGLREGSLILLGARPKMGKTALLACIAKALAKLLRDRLLVQSKGKWIYIWSGEMPIRQLVERLISSELGIESRRLRRGLRKGGLTGIELTSLTNIMGESANMRIVFDETRGITPAQMAMNVAEGVRYWGDPVAVFGDYLQLMQPDDPKMNREQQVSSISRSLKTLALESGAPVFFAAQLNRDLEKREDKRPNPADLRDSGALEQDADVVSFLYRDVVYAKDPDNHPNPNLAEWIWFYNRHGGTGTFNLNFDKRHSKFTETEMVDFDKQLGML